MILASCLDTEIRSASTEQARTVAEKPAPDEVTCSHPVLEASARAEPARPPEEQAPEPGP